MTLIKEISSIKFKFSSYEVFVILLLALTQFTVVLDFMVMSPLGDMLMKSMDLSTSQFGLCVSAYAFSAGISGCKIHAISGSTKITIPPATSGNSILVLPSGGTVVNTSYLQQSFVWNEVPSGLVNGVNRDFVLTKQPLTSGTAMVFRNGIMQEYGATQDYTVSGFTVIFTTGSIPNSGVDKIRVSYQATGIY